MRILIFQPMLKQYRVPLFEQMGQLLSSQGHELKVVCGTPPLKERKKGDNVLSNTEFCIVEKSLWIANEKIHFLNNAMRHIYWADIVITEQANKHIHNYALIFLRLLGKKHFAYWGHGQNRQGNPRSVREKIKKALSTQCDWWFAYTKGVAGYISTLGYPADKITILNNSIDTSEFKKTLENVKSDEILDFRHTYQLDDNSKIGLFCGSLYPDKKLSFLLESAIKIESMTSDFVLLIIGDGIDRPLVENYSKKYKFIKYIGPLFGKEKAIVFKASDVFLCPGLVGLAILDGFAAGLPIFTSDIPNHSPEIEYLEQGVNGVMTAPVIDEYAQAVFSAITSSRDLESLSEGALSSSAQFTIENMARNFVNGIDGFAKYLSLNQHVST